MYRILKRDIPVKIEVEVRNRIGEAVEQAANVIGEIPGTDLKDEVVMIGAHFDTWHASPNASDNTSGVAVALEAARILKAIGAKPRRTIRVALWAGEEQGLHGSREYVLKHFGNPKDPKVGVKPDYEKFSVYFNQDYGAGQFRGIALQGNEQARQIFAAWMDAVPRFRHARSPSRAWAAPTTSRSTTSGCRASSSSRTGSPAPAATPTWTSSTRSRPRT